MRDLIKITSFSFSQSISLSHSFSPHTFLMINSRKPSHCRDKTLIISFCNKHPSGWITFRPITIFHMSHTNGIYLFIFLHFTVEKIYMQRVVMHFMWVWDQRKGWMSGWFMWLWCKVWWREFEREKKCGSVSE